MGAALAGGVDVGSFVRGTVGGDGAVAGVDGGVGNDGFGDDWGERTGGTVARAAATGAGLVGAAGASTRMINERPTNPIAIAAPPYASSALRDRVP